MTEPRPCSAPEAVARARRLLQDSTNSTYGYALGTGNYRPRTVGGLLIDRPWTERESDQAMGCDCAGLVCWAYKLPRSRAGYNKGGMFDVEDDLNCNSMLGDAMGARDLFELATGLPQPGDVIAYPSFFLSDSTGKRLHFIGHTCVVVGVSRIKNWDPHMARYDQLDVVQVKGPDGRKPAAVATDGSIWSHHDETWPKPEHRSYLLRALP